MLKRAVEMVAMYIVLYGWKSCAYPSIIMYRGSYYIRKVSWLKALLAFRYARHALLLFIEARVPNFHRLVQFPYHNISKVLYNVHVQEEEGQSTCLELGARSSLERRHRISELPTLATLSCATSLPTTLVRAPKDSCRNDIRCFVTTLHPSIPSRLD